MSPRRPRPATTLKRFPRVSGDETALYGIVAALLAFSPRERG